MPRGEPRSRLDEARVTLGDRHGEARSHDGPLPGRELVPLAGGEVETGVSRVGALGKDRVLAEPANRELDHARLRAEASLGSASR